ncbi:hypothetical protein JCM11251_005182 [Rhodosporidiobolus azoricus]
MTIRERSQSLEAYLDAPANARPRLDSAELAEIARLVDAGARPTASTSGPPRADNASSTAEEAAGEDEQKEEEAGQAKEKPRKKGKKVEELETVADWYRSKKLQGFPPDEDQAAFPYSEDLNEKVFLWQGDITKLEVDCIVNAANKSLLGGGGVDGAIHSAAGRSLYEECKTLKGASTGETKLTSGHALPAKKIAHTVGPVYSNTRKNECLRQLKSCYSTTLKLCVENGLRTVAFSGISTGVYGYPLDEAALVACSEVRKFLEGPDGDKIDAIIFTVFRQIDLNSYLDNLPEIFPPAPPTSQTPVATEGEGKEADEEEGANDDRTAVDKAQD